SQRCILPGTHSYNQRRCADSEVSGDISRHVVESEGCTSGAGAPRIHKYRVHTRLSQSERPNRGVKEVRIPKADALSRNRSAARIQNREVCRWRRATHGTDVQRDPSSGRSTECHLGVLSNGTGGDARRSTGSWGSESKTSSN